jgi:putative resolvase
VRDMVEVLTSFCARLYGRRSARNRALKAVGCAQHDIGPQAVVGAKKQNAPVTTNRSA